MDFTKQMDIGSILGYSWNVFKKNIFMFLLVGIILNLPSLFISNPNFTLNLLTEGIGVSLVIFLAFIVYSIIGTIFTIFMIDDFISHNVFVVGKTLRKAVSKFFSLFTTMIVMMVLLGLLYLLLVIPGIIFTIFWIFTSYAVVLRGYSGMKALRYSKYLVKNRWWQTFGYLIVVIIVAMIATVILQFPLSLIIPDFYAMMQTGLIATNTIYLVYSVILNSLFLYFSVVMQVFFMSYAGSREKKHVDVNDVKSVAKNVDGMVDIVPVKSIKSIKSTKAVKPAKVSKATVIKKKSSK